ncbi:hypothetical protein AJ80_03769 [Polytolypa hystricis UAMH7299]|uniref:F-box domain-containing protein n=1 Tax=Polytolypa hystricis (strain UAMH7299) TaxID=1447883 RepID=A0A2B7YG42_POLH7|nr:hypothetical protein AJ80_03769 [Polytolypa hystricis UAMH7299]
MYSESKLQSDSPELSQGPQVAAYLIDKDEANSTTVLRQAASSQHQHVDSPKSPSKIGKPEPDPATGAQLDLLFSADFTDICFVKDLVMLSELPSEIIYQIAGYLPTVSDVTHLGQTCQRLHKVVSADDYRIFSGFVQSRFPSIDIPPSWRDAARALTSRSRAFDRHAIVGRFVLPPENARRLGPLRTIRTDHPTLGYRPVIDSYEDWYGSTWKDRREVLVWGAGADLIIRTKDVGAIRKEERPENLVAPTRSRRRRWSNNATQSGMKWAIFNDLHGVDSWDDISGVHILPPSEKQDYEDIIFGRANGRLVRVAISPETGHSEITKTYLTGDRPLDKTDMRKGFGKVLAASLDRRSIAFYDVEAEGETIAPFGSVNRIVHGSARRGASKLLSDERFAIGSDGGIDTVTIYDITRNGIIKTRDLKVDDVDEIGSRKAQILALEPLDSASRAGERPGELFLTGWEDSKTRLHDLRSPRSCVSLFTDTVDDSPIYCIQPIGRERFLVGSGINALLKIFDMRMPGKYSYLDASIPNQKASPPSANNHLPKRTGPYEPLNQPFRRKNISIFLSNRLPHLQNPSFREPHRYRGPIYTMSMPSPSSSTIYVGLEDSVVQLDIASTDDLSGSHRDWYNQNLGLGLEKDYGLDINCQPFDLSCYERPLVEDRGRGVKLMMQDPFWKAVEKQEVRISGWDERWFQHWVANTQKVRGPWRRF